MTGSEHGTALQTTTTTGSDEPLIPRFLRLVPSQAKTLDPKLKPFAEQALAEASKRLVQAGREDFRRELVACLTLTAPSGMSEADRTEWLKAAWGTLAHLPPDLLSIGCTAARRRCDHPSKIVPTILEETTGMLNQRRRDHSEILAAIAKMGDPEPTEERCTPEEAQRIMRELGIEPDAPRDGRPSHRGTPIAPDRDWYIANGVDPATLDAIQQKDAA